MITALLHRENLEMYESYEYLPTPACTEPETEQFFLVENDGTLIINRQIQYEETADVNTIKPPGPIYGVPSQEYYVDLNNTSEFISVPNQYVVSTEANDNVYANNYLLQTISDPTQPEIQAPETISVQKDDSTNGDLIFQGNENIQSASCIEQPDTSSSLTQIALDESQWKMVQEKGWVQLVVNNRQCILDAYGLHEVTDQKPIEDHQVTPFDTSSICNEPLIENHVVAETRTIEDERIFEPTLQPALENHDKQLRPTDCNPVDALSDTYIQENQRTQEFEAGIHNLHDETVQNNAEGICVAPATTAAEDDADSQPKRPKQIGSFLRFKVPFTLEDIPNELFLGQTITEENFTAQIIKVEKNFAPVVLCTEDSDEETGPAPPPPDEAVNLLCENEFAVPSEIEALYLYYCRHEAALRCSDADVRAAEAVLQQLLTVTTTREPMLRRNLLITKITRNVIPGKPETVSKPVFVPGYLDRMSDEEDKWEFIYLPLIIKRMKEPHKGNHKEYCHRNEFILHVHIFEIKIADQAPKISVTFAKQRVLARKPKVHACGACADIFTSEEELRDHQDVTLSCRVGGEQKMVCLHKLNNPEEIGQNTNDNQNPESDTKKEFYLCNCGQPFTKEEEIKNHLEKFKCQKPSNPKEIVKLARLNTNLKNGIILSDKNTKVVCAYCSAKIKLANYTKHIRSHIGTNDDQKNNASKGQQKSPGYKCNMCPGSYVHAASLSRHMLKQHINLKQIVEKESTEQPT